MLAVKFERKENIQMEKICKLSVQTEISRKENSFYAKQIHYIQTTFL